ncbi:MAG: hypothetical protein ACQEW9_10100 [Bacteroidota bacterium]
MNTEEIKAKFKSALSEAKTKLADLEAKREDLSDNLKAEFDEKLAQMKAKKDDLEKKLDQLEDTSEDKWDEVKDHLSDAASSFKEGFSKLGKLFG